MSKRKRKKPTLRMIAAAALLFQPVRDRQGRPVLDPNGCLTYAITLDQAKLMTADQMIALFDMDHDALHALGGSDDWWNFTPRLRPEHREKSRKDTSIVAKSKRLAKQHQQHLARLADRGKAPAAPAVVPRPKPEKKKRPQAMMPGGRRSRYKRHMDGSVSLRVPGSSKTIPLSGSSSRHFRE